MLLLRTNQQFYLDVCAADSHSFPITSLVSFVRGTGLRKPSRVVPTRETGLCVTCDWAALVGDIIELAIDE